MGSYEQWGQPNALGATWWNRPSAKRAGSGGTSGNPRPLSASAGTPAPAGNANAGELPTTGPGLKTFVNMLQPKRMDTAIITPIGNDGESGGNTRRSSGGGGGPQWSGMGNAGERRKILGGVSEAGYAGTDENKLMNNYDFEPGSSARAAALKIRGAGGTVARNGSISGLWPAAGSASGTNTNAPGGTFDPATGKWKNDQTGAELQARANGGPINSGQPYVVGEQGPEVIVPAQNGTVLPNEVLATYGEGKNAVKALATPYGYGVATYGEGSSQGMQPSAGKSTFEALMTQPETKLSNPGAEALLARTPANLNIPDTQSAPQRRPASELSQILRSIPNPDGRPEGVKETDWRRYLRTPQALDRAIHKSDQNEQWNRMDQNYQRSRQDSTADRRAAKEEDFNATLDSYGGTIDVLARGGHITPEQIALYTHERDPKRKAGIAQTLIDMGGLNAKEAINARMAKAEAERRSVTAVENINSPDGKVFVPYNVHQDGTRTQAGGSYPNKATEPDILNYIPYGDGTEASETYRGKPTGRTAKKMSGPWSKESGLGWKPVEKPTAPKSTGSRNTKIYQLDEKGKAINFTDYPATDELPPGWFRSAPAAPQKPVTDKPTKGAGHNLFQ